MKLVVNVSQNSVQNSMLLPSRMLNHAWLVQLKLTRTTYTWRPHQLWSNSIVRWRVAHVHLDISSCCIHLSRGASPFILVFCYLKYGGIKDASEDSLVAFFYLVPWRSMIIMVSLGALRRTLALLVLLVILRSQSLVSSRHDQLRDVGLVYFLHHFLCGRVLCVISSDRSNWSSIVCEFCYWTMLYMLLSNSLTLCIPRLSRNNWKPGKAFGWEIDGGIKGLDSIDFMLLNLQCVEKEAWEVGWLLLKWKRLRILRLSE